MRTEPSPATPSPATIELRVEEIADLFDPFDPFPLPTRDLSRSAEDFIVGWARELRLKTAPSITLHVEKSEGGDAGSVTQAIANHFTARAKNARRDLIHLFRIGRTSLVIGVTALLACVLASSLVGAMMHDPLAHFFEEGLIIVGWVANWRPIEIFLYEWWPIESDRRLYERLAAARIELRAT
jgi:hypothetical protein